MKLRFRSEYKGDVDALVVRVSRKRVRRLVKKAKRIGAWDVVATEKCKLEWFESSRYVLGPTVHVEVQARKRWIDGKVFIAVACWPLPYYVGLCVGEYAKLGMEGVEVE